MDGPHASFSIIVPTFCRADQLDECLHALGNLKYPSKLYEVIVVDDGGDVPVDSIISAHSADMQIKLIRQDNAGPAASRNRGAEAATGEFLAFTDDDCQPEPEWLCHFNQALQAHPDAMVGGNTINALSQYPCSSASQLLIDYIYEYYNTPESGSTFYTSNNIAVSRIAFGEIGGFDTTFPLAAAEDRDLCDRWNATSRPMLYVPESKIRHLHAMRLRSFWRQHHTYGRGAYQYHIRRVMRGISAPKVEPLRFYSRLVLYPLSKPGLHQRLRLTLLMVVSQVANISGYAIESLRLKQAQSPKAVGESIS